MSNLRFTLVAIALFAGAFAGVFWASKGFPVMAMRVALPKPDAPAPVPQPLPSFELAGKPKTPAIPERDHLAQTAIQAASAYIRTPCDMAAKAAFIVAASTYLRAKATDAGAPAEAHVHQAIKSAIEAGGIGRDEFPAGAEISVVTTTGLRCTNSAGLLP
jgi:hypothetical protein